MGEAEGLYPPEVFAAFGVVELTHPEASFEIDLREGEDLGRLGVTEVEQGAGVPERWGAGLARDASRCEGALEGTVEGDRVQERGGLEVGRVVGARCNLEAPPKQAEAEEEQGDTDRGDAEAERRKERRSEALRSRHALLETTEEAELLVEVVVLYVGGPTLSGGLHEIAQEAKKPGDFGLGHRVRRGGWIESDPTGAVYEGLDPRVGVALADGVEAAEAIVGAADEPGDVAGWDADGSEEDGHCGRVELAMTAVRLEEEMVEGVRGVAREGVEVVMVLAAKLAFDRLGALEGCVCIGRPASGELGNARRELRGQGGVAGAVLGREGDVAGGGRGGNIDVVLEASVARGGVLVLIFRAGDDAGRAAEELGVMDRLEGYGIARYEDDGGIDGNEVEQQDSVVGVGEASEGDDVVSRGEGSTGGGGTKPGAAIVLVESGAAEVEGEAGGRVGSQGGVVDTECDGGVGSEAADPTEVDAIGEADHPFGSIGTEEEQ